MNPPLPPRHALLIDDESLAREEFRRLLLPHPHIRVIDEADDVPAARTRLACRDYDLVFLDIELAGGTGFDLVPHVAPHAEIIFVTAHDRFALRAFEVNALDYLLKPVSPARLAQSLGRLGAPQPPDPTAASTSPATPESGLDSEAAETPLAAVTANDTVFLKNHQGARFVPVKAIAAVTSCDNYSEVFVSDHSRYLVRRSLKTWETALPTDLFVRVHRQAIVNLGHLERIEGLDRDTPSLLLRGVKQPVVCSHRLSPELRRRLDSRGA